MSQFPNLRPFVILLLAGGVLFPIALGIVLGVGALLSAMGDSTGGSVLNRIGLALAIFWILDLILLVLCQGLHALDKTRKSGDNNEES